MVNARLKLRQDKCCWFGKGFGTGQFSESDRFVYFLNVSIKMYVKN